MTTPALYRASVCHQRRQRISTSFIHNYYLWLVDLDALPRLPLLLRPFAGFRARDHLGDPRRGIRENLEIWLAEQGVELHGGRVVMLAGARVLGYVFNPLTLYWCHNRGGDIECVVAEVHNTYRQRHRYLLRPDSHGNAETDKEFYVSPFLEMGGYYRMHVPEPAERLAVSVALHQGSETPLTAVLTGERSRATSRELLRMVLRYPLAPQRVATAIRVRGVLLWLRGIPVVPREVRTGRKAKVR